jgi:acylphosphatase
MGPPADSSRPSQIRRHLVIDGVVQGVWFRESCRRQAGAHGVAGWVFNRADGRVEAVLEGDVAGVQAVEAWCHRGPARAHVTGVEAVEERPVGEVGFRVR